MELYLKPEKNPEYGNLMERYYSHSEEWNAINSELHQLVIPKVYSRRVQRKLKVICRKLAELQQKWLALNGDAIRFHANPIYRIPNDAASNLTFQHHQDVLINRINHYESTMTLLSSNFNLSQAQLNSVLNFNVAIASFGLSFIGLAITLGILLIS